MIRAIVPAKYNKVRQKIAHCELTRVVYLCIHIEQYIVCVHVPVLTYCNLQKKFMLDEIFPQNTFYKPTWWVFVFQKIWQILKRVLLGHFIKHKPRISK